MKKNIYIGLLAVSLLASCNELEPEDLDFGIEVEKTTVKTGEPVTFNFEGNPNFITIFSGDEGHKYANRNRTEVDASDIEAVTLSFTLMNKAAGSHKDPLAIYLSADFPGLSADPVADKALVHTHEWRDITATCLDGVVDGVTTNIGEVNLNDYRDGFVLAFRYQGKRELAPQRTIVITKLQVVNKLKNGQAFALQGSDINFSVFDTNPSNKEGDHYKKVISGVVEAGTWNLTNWVKNEFRMIGATKVDPASADNDDWLISPKIVMNASCEPDKGEVIKDISRRVTRYEHVYNTPGTYTVTFLVGNSTVEGEKMIVKEFVIEVKE